MKHKRFARWWAPFVAAAIGAYFGWFRMGVAGFDRSTVGIVMTVGCFVVGLLVLVLDPADKGPVEVERDARDEVAPTVVDSAPPDRSPAISSRETLIGRVFGLFAVLLCWAPLLGLGWGILALVVNWRSEGTGKILSVFGLSMTALLHGGFAILWALKQMGVVGR